MSKNPFRHLGEIGFAGASDGDGPDEIDISTEVQNEMVLVGKLVRDLLRHGRATGITAQLAEAANQFMQAVCVDDDPVPAPSWRDPADAVGNLRRIVALDAQEHSPVDEPMLSTLTALAGQGQSILATLELSRQAQSALEDILLHQGVQMTDADRDTRIALVARLSQQLDAIGA